MSGAITRMLCGEWVGELEMVLRKKGKSAKTRWSSLLSRHVVRTCRSGSLWAPLLSVAPATELVSL